MLFRIASLVAILTVLSKVLGLARDLVVAHYYGTSVVADAYNMAYMFTGNFFVIFACIGGPVYTALMAILPRYEGLNLISFIEKISRQLFLVVCCLALFLYLAKSYLLSFFINEKTNTEYFVLTLRQIDLLLPLILCTAPLAVVSTVLNFTKHYVSPTLAPGILNLVLILALFIFGAGQDGLILALATSIGAIVSLLLQLPSYFRVKADFLKQALLATNPSQDFYNLLFPTLIATGLNQVMLFIDGYYCNGLPQGALTAITLANRMIQMPMGILLTAILVPLFPRITKLFHENNILELKRVLYKSLFYLTILALPAVMIGISFAKPIIALLFQRGAFDESSTILVSQVFFYLCISILPYIYKDCLVRTAYSIGDTKMPLQVTMILIFIKLLSNAVLVPVLGVNGIALSTTVVSLLGAVILTYRLRKVIL